VFFSEHPLRTKLGDPTAEVFPSGYFIYPANLPIISLGPSHDNFQPLMDFITLKKYNKIK